MSTIHASSTPLGLALPVTSTFAFPLSIYYVFLQLRVIRSRLATKTSLAQSSNASAAGDDPLLAAFRTQANFNENVPLALILAGLFEINGGSKSVLTAVLSVLTVGRLMHGEFGLMVPGAGGIGRPVGFATTMLTIVSLAAYGAWNSKLYWGF